MRNIILIISVFSLSNFIVTDSVELLMTKIASYQGLHKRAKIDLFFNQSKYYPGDTAYFRILYISANDNALIKGNEIVNIHLFDTTGQSVLSTKAIITNGTGGYELIIPDNTKSGIYKLVAYTNWMKNYQESLYFSKDFHVSGQNIYSTTLRKSEASIKISVEGGHMIADVQNNVLISTAQIESGSIVIRTIDGKEISNTIVSSTGHTLIPITPQKNITYFAELIHNGKLIANSKLPEVHANGFAVRIESADKSKSSSISIEIERAPNFKNRDSYLLLVGSNGVLHNRKLEFESTNILTVTLPKVSRGGTFQLAVVDDEFKIWAERTISMPNSINLNSEISISNTKFRPREKVEVSTNISNSIGEPVKGILAVRVLKKILFNESEKDLNNNFEVISDIGYRSESWKFSGLSQSTINTMLIGEKCHWLDWGKVINEVKPQYLRTSYQILTGRVFPYSPSKAKDSLLLNIYLPSELIGYDTYVKGDGMFQLPINYPFYGQLDAFYSLTSNGKAQNDLSLDIFIDSLYSSVQHFTVGDTKDPYYSYSIKRRVIENSYNYFQKRNTRKSITNREIELELGGVDIAINLADYVPFASMSEVVKEVLKYVDHRKSGEENFIRVYTTHKYPTNQSTPLFVIDGILTRDVEQFLSLNPKTVLSVKVVKDWNKLINLGTLGDNGVIIVSTKGLNPATIKRQQISLPGFCKPSIQMPIISSTANSPYLKPCLYWNSNIAIDNNGVTSFSFYTSDEKSDYVIEIVGLTEGGNIFRAEKSFVVY